MSTPDTASSTVNPTAPVVEPAKPTPTPTPTPAAKSKAKKTNYMPVYGLMVHPFTGVRFEPGQETEHEADSWVNSQVRAGKLSVARG